MLSNNTCCTYLDKREIFHQARTWHLCHLMTLNVPDESNAKYCVYECGIIPIPLKKQIKLMYGSVHRGPTKAHFTEDLCAVPSILTVINITVDQYKTTKLILFFCAVGVGTATLTMRETQTVLVSCNPSFSHSAQVQNVAAFFNLAVNNSRPP